MNSEKATRQPDKQNDHKAQHVPSMSAKSKSLAGAEKECV